MNQTQQILAWIAGGYIFIVVAYVILHIMVMFAIIGIWRQTKRVANAMELNRYTLERIAGGVNSFSDTQPWIKR